MSMSPERADICDGEGDALTREHRAEMGDILRGGGDAITRLGDAAITQSNGAWPPPEDDRFDGACG